MNCKEDYKMFNKLTIEELHKIIEETFHNDITKLHEPYINEDFDIFDEDIKNSYNEEEALYIYYPISCLFKYEKVEDKWMIIDLLGRQYSVFCSGGQLGFGFKAKDIESVYFVLISKSGILNENEYDRKAIEYREKQMRWYAWIVSLFSRSETRKEFNYGEN